MRRALTILVVALVVGGVFGTLMTRDPGYVLVTYENMSFESSLWFALFGLILGYFVLRLMIGIVRRLLRGGSGVAVWQQNRRSRLAQAHTVRGLLRVGEGDWAAARKSLLADVEHVDSPLLNYVGAARAANELGDGTDRDALLAKAEESVPGSTLAVALTKAELQMSVRQYREANGTLLSAKSAAPNHPRLLRLLADCYEHLHDWKSLLALAPELQRRHAVTPDQLRESRLRWSARYFAEPGTGAEPEIARQLLVEWNGLDKELRSDPSLAAACARALIAVGANDDAESLLSKTLERVWNDELVSLYGCIRVDRSHRQISRVEGWLKDHPNDATLLLALGRVSLTNRDWAKAREYFEESLKCRRGEEVYGELGRLCLAMGDRTRATELLAQSIALGSQLPALPLPDVAPPDASAARS